MLLLKFGAGWGCGSAVLWHTQWAWGEHPSNFHPSNNNAGKPTLLVKTGWFGALGQVLAAPLVMLTTTSRGWQGHGPRCAGTEVSVLVSVPGL